MATWADFARAEPEKAALCARILRKYGIAYLGTVRPDGQPRIHPVCPVLVNNSIYLGLIKSTPKRRDLDRDSRFVLHALPGPNDCEFCLTGNARPLTPTEMVQLEEAANERQLISLDTALYELELHEVRCTTYEVDQGSLPVPTKTKWTAEV